jgi:hypothetical protein
MSHNGKRNPPINNPSGLGRILGVSGGRLIGPFEAESVIDQFGDVSQLSHAPRSVSSSYNPLLGMPDSSALLCCLVTIETSPILLAVLGVIITIRPLEPGRSSIGTTSSYRSRKDLPFPLAGIMPIPVSAAVRYICGGLPTYLDRSKNIWDRSRPS